MAGAAACVAPCHAQEPPARFQGCYQVRVGPWSRPPNLPIPDSFRLDVVTIRGYGLWSGVTSRIASPREQAMWRLLPDTTLLISWATPRDGTVLSLRPGGDSLRGTASFGGDSTPASPKADAVAWRTSCDGDWLGLEIAGTVSDTALHPVPHAVIQVVGSSVAGITDSNGRYRLCNIPTPHVSLRAAYVGYVPVVKDSIDLVESLTTVNFRLAVAPVGYRETVPGDGAPGAGRRRPPRTDSSIRPSRSTPASCKPH